MDYKKYLDNNLADLILNYRKAGDNLSKKLDSSLKYLLTNHLEDFGKYGEWHYKEHGYKWYLNGSEEYTDQFHKLYVYDKTFVTDNYSFYYPYTSKNLSCWDELDCEVKLNYLERLKEALDDIEIMKKSGEWQ